MARIFISHSSVNSAEAIEMRDWLAQNGWDDVFLDLDPERGIRAGDKWQETLRTAAYRCEAILFLVSREWLASKWCLAEYLYAKKLGKRVIPVVIDDAPFDDLPVEMVAEHQIIDLRKDPDARKRLRIGLEAAGVSAETFAFPDGRRPYPGLSPLDEDDAAAFFGRDAQILAALDELRRMAETGARKLFVVLGASGAGKSSLLRAGLMPRLNRDDRAFLTLPPIRPAGAPLSGRQGLWAALERLATGERLGALLPADLPKTRGAIAAQIGDAPGALVGYVDALRDAARRASLGDAPPTVVFSIDQGEELFAAEGRPEAERFLEILSETLRNDRHSLAAIAIRSDAYPLLQAETRLPAELHQPFNLGPMDVAGFKEVIEGPARLADLEIEPALTEALLRDAKGADALPLLAFTLERLHRDFGAAGALKRADYEALGGVSGAISAAVDEAATRPDAGLPSDLAARNALMRRAFIPHLVRVLPDGAFVRRVAARDDIPSNARPVVDALIEGRLLVADRTPDGVETVEIAHEALLREWSLLVGWLDEERDFLVWRERIASDRMSFAADQRGLLTDRELAIALDWLETRAGDVASAEAAYIQRSAAEAAKRRDAARRRSRNVAIAASLAAFVGFGLAGAATHQYWSAETARQEAIAAEAVAEVERNQALKTQSLFLADLSRQRLEAGDAAEAAALAATALPRPDADDPRPYAPEAELALDAALQRLHENATTAAGAPVVDLASAPGGERLAVLRRDDTGATAIIVETPRNARGLLREAPLILGGDAEPTALAWSRATGALAVARNDGSVRLLDGDTLRQTALIDVQGVGRAPHRLAFSPDGARLAVLVGTFVRVYDLAAPAAPLLDHEMGIVTPYDVAFSHDGRFVAIPGVSGEMTEWSLDSVADEPILHDGVRGYSIASFRAPGLWNAPADRAYLFGGARGGMTLAIGDPLRAAIMFRVHASAVEDVAISPDGKRFATVDRGGRARLERVFWDDWLAEGGPQAEAFETVVATSMERLGQGDRMEELPVVETVREGVSVQAHDAPAVRVVWLDESRVATAGDDGLVRVASVKPARILAPWPSDQRAGAIRCMFGGGFAAEGRIAAPCGNEDIGEIFIWRDVETSPTRVKDPSPAPISMILSADGRRALTTGYGAGAALIDLVGARVIASLDQGDGNVAEAAIAPNGARLATIDSDAVLRLFDGEGGLVAERRLETEDGEKRAVERLLFSPDGARLFVAPGALGPTTPIAPGGLIALDDLTAETLFDLGPGVAIAAAFSPSGDRLATGTGEGVLKLWSFDATGAPELVATYEHDGPIRSAAFSRDGDQLFAGAANGVLLALDHNGALQAATQTGAGLIDMITPHPSGERIVLHGRNRSLLWDIDADGAVAVLPERQDWRGFSQDGAQLLSVSNGPTFWPVAPNRSALTRSASDLGVRCLSAAERVDAFLEPARGADACVDPWATETR